MNKIFKSAVTVVASAGLVMGISSTSAFASNPIQDNSPSTDISVSGTPSVGSVLTVVKPTYTGWTDTSVLYQWYRCTSATPMTYANDFASQLWNLGCTSLGFFGASSTYTVVSADVGKYLTVTLNMSDIVNGAPQADHYAKSLAASVLATAASSTPAPQTPTLAPQTPAAAVPAAVKAKKKLTIPAKTAAGLPVKVVASGGCKVKPVVNTVTTKVVVGKKTKKVKTKVTTGYTVTMGKKGTTCTITQSNTGDATYDALNSVTTVKAS